MKSLRICLSALVVLLLVLGLLLWFLPARWAVPWIEPHLHGLRLEQVQGTLWQGSSARVVSVDGQMLGKAQWQLSRRALLGAPELHLTFAGPSLSFAGVATSLSDGKIAAHDITIRADLTALGLAAIVPLGQPRGALTANADHAVLQGGWPMELQLQAQWNPAVMQTREGDVALGALVLQVQSHGGIIQAQLRDAGEGPLAADGDLQLSPLGWRLDATLSSRQTDPKLDHWLATLGTPSADGSVHIQRHGGLAGTLPSSRAEKDGGKP